MFTNFEVVDLSPAITSVSPTQAVAGTSVTITGRNFSGAAGRLSVWFGTNQAQAMPTDDAQSPKSEVSGLKSGSGVGWGRCPAGLGKVCSVRHPCLT